MNLIIGTYGVTESGLIYKVIEKKNKDGETWYDEDGNTWYIIECIISSDYYEKGLRFEVPRCAIHAHREISEDEYLVRLIK